MDHTGHTMTSRVCKTLDESIGLERVVLSHGCYTAIVAGSVTLCCWAMASIIQALSKYTWALLKDSVYQNWWKVQNHLPGGVVSLVIYKEMLCYFTLSAME